jgi:hypothetical protein
MYKIVRMFVNRNNRTIKTGLTLEQAQTYCQDPLASSRTCQKAAGKRRTKLYGPWFDGYQECKR